MRIMRLSEAGRAAMTELADGPIHSTRAGTLARRLTDAGAAHPRPPRRTEPIDLTVIIPVKDRADMLAQCLSALGRRYPVVVVDDASRDRQAVAAVANAHGARLVVRQIDGGPAAARNTGVAAVCSEFIAFVDSDTLPTGPSIELLAGQLADPLVAAVAPRIVAVTGCADSASQVHRRERQPRPRRQGGAGRPRVPGVLRADRRHRPAPCGAAGHLRPGRPLRPADARRRGRRPHLAPPQRRLGGSATTRRRRSRTTNQELVRPAAPKIHLRHLGRAARPTPPRGDGTPRPAPWPTLAVGALLLCRPILAAAAFTGSVLGMRRTLTREKIPPNGVVPAMARATQQTSLGIGRYTTQFAAPLLIAALVKPGGRSRARQWARRLALASLLLGPPVTTWRQRRPDLDPARFVLGQLADDVSYGAGVWTGAIKARTTMPLRPSILWHPLRIDAARRTS